MIRIKLTRGSVWNSRINLKRVCDSRLICQVSFFYVVIELNMALTSVLEPFAETLKDKWSEIGKDIKSYFEHLQSLKSKEKDTLRRKRLIRTITAVLICITIAIIGVLQSNQQLRQVLDPTRIFLSNSSAKALQNSTEGAAASTLEYRENSSQSTDVPLAPIGAEIHKSSTEAGVSSDVPIPQFESVTTHQQIGTDVRTETTTMPSQTRAIVEPAIETQKLSTVSKL